jgi:hypothetical protein
VQHWVIRVVGHGVVQKRLQMEAGWRTYVEEVVETLGGVELATHRHINFTDHPSTRPDLAALESVDEEVVLYAAPGADPRPFTAGNASARAAAEAGLVNRIRERGLDVQLLQLYVGPLLGASSPERATRNTTVAATRSKLLISGSGLVPPRVGVQTAALLALRSAAEAAELPLLSCNITSWQLASSADARRLNVSASGLVEADVRMQTPGNSFQPSDFWQKVAPRLPQATEAAGVPLRLWFLSATTVYMTENGTEIGRSADVAPVGSFAAAPSPDAIGGGGEHVTFKIVAIIAVLSAGVVLVASLIGLTVWLCLRRRRQRRHQRKASCGRHAADCPLHVCTCHRAKAQSASPRALQGGTHSGPLPPAMLLNADPGHRSPAGSGGAYGSKGQLSGSSCGSGCRVHALLDHSPGCSLQPFGRPKSPGSSGGATGALQNPSSGGGRPPRAPPHVGSARSVAPSGGSCCCAGAAAMSDCHPGDGVVAPDTPPAGGGAGGCNRGMGQ